jgi:SAM-dependent methyltransferase
MAEQAAGRVGVGDAERAGAGDAGRADQVRLLFDAKAATWPEKYGPEGSLTGRLAQFAEGLARRVPAGGRVLDLGCGTGDLARAADAAGLRVTACDISPEMLLRAASGDRSQTGPGGSGGAGLSGSGGAVDWVRLDPQWRRLPFESAAFDAVVAASVLEYVERPVDVLSECARVLRPAGIVLCTVPDPTHPVRWLEWLASAVARVPSVAAAGARWPRLDSYLTYLRISRQRRGARWWCAAAARAGLLTVPAPVAAAGRSPLRLLAFQRPGTQRGQRPGIPGGQRPGSRGGNS